MTVDYLSQDTSSFDNLIAGDQINPITEEFTLQDGEDVVRGELMGKITANGKLIASDDGAGDGSEVAYAIAAEDKAASGSDEKILCYVAGIFNSNAMTFGGTHTAAGVYDDLRGVGIYLKEAYPKFGE